ncbi:MULTISPECIES: class I SAM-dependent methyltransferase [unclassified Phyllobacterium]|uniref:class I SAM-dependent methyltransferase n=1 Tax=unclassified Phyllobacterium TaxID=2638441 RepID=UPI003012F669
MSGFDLNWLDLREPLDQQARDQTLLKKAARFVQSAERRTILDLGSGTGSTFRAMAPYAPGAQWRLIDLDEKLLQEAARRHAQDNNVAYQHCNLNDLASLSLDEADLVSASALFDLCSQEFVDDLADRLVKFRSGLYAALNYTGEIVFSVSHTDDELMVRSFNHHQNSDKGFGPALGPRSTHALAAALSRSGYSVEIAQSDWLIDKTAIELHRLFVDGMASAVAETGMVGLTKINQWREFRVAQTTTAKCCVGHSDVLALPQSMR